MPFKDAPSQRADETKAHMKGQKSFTNYLSTGRKTSDRNFCQTLEKLHFLTCHLGLTSHPASLLVLLSCFAHPSCSSFCLSHQSSFSEAAYLLFCSLLSSARIIERHNQLPSLLADKLQTALGESRVFTKPSV